MTFRIALISSGQPSLNPRLVKEADALANAGYRVTVLYVYWNNWGTAFDEKLLPSKKWQAIRIGGHPQHEPVTYFFSRLIHKMAKLGLKLFGPKYFASCAIARSSFFLSRKAKKHKADLYIGHNLGALPAVIQAGVSNRKPCGFDAEDFHRNEISDVPSNSDVILKTYLEDKYIPQVNYLTASSPQISRVYDQLYPGKNPVTILNVFPVVKNAPQTFATENGPVKLLWFSQTIGYGRGIEDILDTLRQLDDHPFELHLLGHYHEDFKQELSRNNKAVHFHEPVNPDELVQFASQFDIGMAAERSVPYNRDICLTNKIFTYMQAGLAIIASNTTAQQSLLDQHPGIGMVYENGNLSSLTAALQHYRHNKNELAEARRASLKLAREKYNWEQESITFLETVEKTLKKQESL